SDGFRATQRAKCGSALAREMPIRFYKPSTSLSPVSISTRSFAGRALTRWVSSSRAIVISYDTLTTDGLGKPDSDLPKRTLHGAFSRNKFDVMTATMTVAIRLSLNAFA
ncbi:MAG: hypothetical protein ACRCWJ_13745, partial [Casimicrobium sp.]